MKRAFQYRVFSLCVLAILLEVSGVTGTRNASVARAAEAGTLLAAAPPAAVYQPLNEQLEVFVVDANGALNVVWKDNNGKWRSPVGLTAPGFTKPGASVAAVYYPTYEQLEVFVVDKNGALNVVSKDHNGPWHAPVGLTGPRFAPPGAPLVAVYQPLNEQLEVFVVAANGALNVVWKDNNGNWKRPLALTNANFVAPGAHVAGVCYPSYKQLEVFLIDKDGVFNVVWKENNGAWKSPVGLSPRRFAPPGTPLTAFYQPRDEHLEVLLVDNRGAINVIWKVRNGIWKTPVGLTPAGSMKLGSSLTSIYYPQNEQIDVLSIDNTGAFNVLWKDHDGPWKGPVGVTERHFEPGAPVAAALYPRFDQLEAFSTDRHGVLYVEWKVRNQAWVPCPFPLMGKVPTSQVPVDVTIPTVLKTERVGQLTGNPDPDNLPTLNATNNAEWSGSGVLGTDLGANTEHNGKLFIFFGDVVPGNPNGSPARDTDLVAWTSDSALRPGGFTLHPVKVSGGRFFDPFTVDSNVDSNIGILPIGRTPTGAFSYETWAYVFGLWDDPADPLLTDPISHEQYRIPTTFLASKEDPGEPGPYRCLESVFSKSRFWQVAPVVVKNAEHPGLFPESRGDGLVLLGGGHKDAIHLAWMQLEPGRGPVTSSVRYYTGNPDPNKRWTPAENDFSSARAHEAEAVPVVNLPPHYTSVSAAWLPVPKRWIVVYSRGYEDRNVKFPAGPIVARFGPDPWTWSEEVQIFNTCRDRAFGHFMHWPSADDVNTRVGPFIFGDAPSWAYGAFLLNRFTSYNAATRELSLAYLMSTHTPYQVQVMRTQLRMPLVPARPTVDQVTALRNVGIDFSVPEADLRQWLSNSEFTPYPAIAAGLLTLLEGKRLRKPVYLDVIVWNYEHGPGASSPRRVADVNARRLKASVLAGYNERHDEAIADFQTLLR